MSDDERFEVTVGLGGFGVLSGSQRPEVYALMNDAQS
jgi:hypothetical protein